MENLKIFIFNLLLTIGIILWAKFPLCLGEIYAQKQRNILQPNSIGGHFQN